MPANLRVLALAGSAFGLVLITAAGAQTPPAADIVLPDAGQATCSIPRLGPGDIVDGPLQIDSIGIALAGPLDRFDLANEVAPFIGRSVSQASLGRLAGRIACLAQARGAVAADAGVTPTGVPGTWSLAVREARVQAVAVDTGDARLDGFLRKAFGQVKPGQALRASALRQGLAVANAQGVWSISLKAAPDPVDPSLVTLVIDAPVPEAHVFASLQNNAPPSVGQWWGGATAITNGLTPAYEQTQIGVFHALQGDRQRGANLSSRALLGEDGLVGRVDLGFYEQTPDERGGLPDTHGETRLARVELSRPVYTAPGVVVVGRAGVESVSQRTERLGGPTTARDDITVGYLGVHADRIDGPSGQSLDLSVRQGLDAFGASRPGDPRLSRPDADPQATVLRGEASGRRPLAGGTLQARARGQWTDDPLVAYEEFNFGGAPGGRGLDAGALAGDRGVSLGLDWFGPARRMNGGWSISPVAFVEGAQAWNLDDYGPRRSRIVLGGGGLRINFGDEAHLDIVYARPVGEPKGVDEDRFGPRLLFTLTTRLGGR
ncbi:MAG: hypothetical protein K1X35_07205 [Caulobacteraceae bacterium]|nr:hypothetical protein [Caulobacteraceae bacterium]